MRKATAIILILSMVSTLNGCATLKRKFTRKKKAKPVRPMFYKEDEEAEGRPVSELYSMHYVYWKSWIDELINNAGRNRKRDKRAIGEAIGNLLDMQKYLTKEKAQELGKYTEEVKKIADRIETSGVSKVQLGKLRRDLDKVKLRISKKFYYKKVKDYLRQDQL